MDFLIRRQLAMDYSTLSSPNLQDCFASLPWGCTSINFVRGKFPIPSERPSAIPMSSRPYKSVKSFRDPGVATLPVLGRTPRVNLRAAAPRADA
jgi:hypothetical protein